MIDPRDFHQTLIDSGVTFFTGVPDSLLSDFGAFIQENSERHVIAANEGNAVALAAGTYLATGQPALVYLQNSGLGNTINPLISLTDPDVYGIPMILLVGWRGEPGTKDEPQHMKQGEATTALFDAIDTPWMILPDEPASMVETVQKAVRDSIDLKQPVALIARKGTFSGYKLATTPTSDDLITREESVVTAAQCLSEDSIVVATTGKISRELYSYRIDSGIESPGDFLMVGSMGHASQIAMGIALEKPDTPVVCFDGDGAAIMHMGSLAIIGTSDCKNLKHIVFNNSAHDSVGGQPTVADQINLTEIARSCGYSSSIRVDTREGLQKAMASSGSGPEFIEIVVAKGARDSLVRPSTTPMERKLSFMDHIRGK